MTAADLARFGQNCFLAGGLTMAGWWIVVNLAGLPGWAGAVCVVVVGPLAGHIIRRAAARRTALKYDDTADHREP